MLKIEYENKDHRRILITASDGNIPRWQQLKFELLDLDQEESKSIRKNIVSIPSLSFFRLYLRWMIQLKPKQILDFSSQLLCVFQNNVLQNIL